MSRRAKTRLNPKLRYLQVALNSTLEEANRIISLLPVSDRIIIEAGTPLIKRYGVGCVAELYRTYEAHLYGGGSLGALTQQGSPIDTLSLLAQAFTKPKASAHPPTQLTRPYIVADLKTMDRGATEVAMAVEAGASAVIALGSAPIETQNAFIAACEAYQVDAMIDMMNVEYPLAVLRALTRLPAVVILHRGVDEEELNHEKQIPLHEIRRIKGAFDMMIAIAGGDTLREVQRSVFNDADIVVVWKSVFQRTEETAALVQGFLKEIK